MYADDTSVTCSAEDIDTLCDDLRTELTNISEWMRQNKLSLNANKSEFLIVGHKRQLNGIHEPVQLQVDEEPIRRVTSTSCKSYKIVLLESLQIAALMPQADHLLQSWAGRPLKSSLAMSLKQWSSSRSMTWLHNTCVTSSQKTQHAPPATSRTLRLI